MSGPHISSPQGFPSNQMNLLSSLPSMRKAYLGGRQVSEPEDMCRISEILERMAVNFSDLVTRLTKEMG